MSIIISNINGPRAFVFSEGRLTSDNGSSDNHNKTLSLFDEQIVSAFCGLLILDDYNNPNCVTSVGNIIKHVEWITNYVPLDYFKFLNDVSSEIERHYAITRSSDIIKLHFVRVHPLGQFGFTLIEFWKDANGVSQHLINQEIQTSGAFYVNGDPSTFSVIVNHLNGRNFTSDNQMIAENYHALDLGIAMAPNTCGGTKFYQKIR